MDRLLADLGKKFEAYEEHVKTQRERIQEHKKKRANKKKSSNSQEFHVDRQLLENHGRVRLVSNLTDQTESRRYFEQLLNSVDFSLVVDKSEVEPQLQEDIKRLKTTLNLLRFLKLPMKGELLS